MIFIQFFYLVYYISTASLRISRSPYSECKAISLTTHACKARKILSTFIMSCDYLASVYVFAPVAYQLQSNIRLYRAVDI